MNNNYLNTLVVKDIIEWYDIPVQYSAVDIIGNLYLFTVIEFDDEEYNDIYQIQNMNNVYEYLYTVKICRLNGKIKLL